MSKEIQIVFNWHFFLIVALSVSSFVSYYFYNFVKIKHNTSMNYNLNLTNLLQKEKNGPERIFVSMIIYCSEC